MVNKRISCFEFILRDLKKIKINFTYCLFVVARATDQEQGHGRYLA